LTAFVFFWCAAGSAPPQGKPGSDGDKSQTGYYSVESKSAQAYQCGSEAPAHANSDGYCWQQAARTAY